jgi:hypothetical protein
MVTSINDYTEISITEYDKDSRIIRTTTSKENSEINIAINSKQENYFEETTCQYIYTHYPKTFFYDSINKKRQETYYDFEYYIDKPKDSYSEFLAKAFEYGSKESYIDKNTFTMVYNNIKYLSDDAKYTYQCKIENKSIIYIKVIETEYSVYKYEYKLELKNVDLDKNFD